MENSKYPFFFFQLLLLILLSSSLLVKDVAGSRLQIPLEGHKLSQMARRKLSLKESTSQILIGSVAPTCTYNECRGCKYRCTAEQIPVEGNDPINSSYHYRCICHR